MSYGKHAREQTKKRSSSGLVILVALCAILAWALYASSNRNREPIDFGTMVKEAGSYASPQKYQ